KLERSTQAEASDGVERAAFVAPCIVAQSHIARTVIVIRGHIGPAEFHWLDALLQSLGNKKHPATFRAKQPFVSVGCKRIDIALANVNGKSAQALDGVDKIDASMPPANLADLAHGRAVAIQKSDKTHRKQARAAAGRIHTFQRVEDRKPGHLDAFGFQPP